MIDDSRLPFTCASFVAHDTEFSLHLLRLAFPFIPFLPLLRLRYVPNISPVDGMLLPIFKLCSPLFCSYFHPVPVRVLPRPTGTDLVVYRQ